MIRTHIKRIGSQAANLARSLHETIKRHAEAGLSLTSFGLYVAAVYGHVMLFVNRPVLGMVLMFGLLCLLWSHRYFRAVQKQNDYQRGYQAADKAIAEEVRKTLLSDRPRHAKPDSESVS